MSSTDSSTISLAAGMLASTSADDSRLRDGLEMVVEGWLMGRLEWGWVGAWREVWEDVSEEERVAVESEVGKWAVEEDSA
jgi:hypothetical protein